ncbi:hypothetical protein [Thermosipho atlanticus]|uniref:Uncharacterized protein n=1 Tax=Thermosipho atlanticus DSM 15807 TaxID=1123380 RepID=A0A1M5ST11_9BACT|nr:hypothetical protein [Thermosipho atlanticus]SHH41632.1 hypothetical protein SAMN02745199_1065 [Thermosipho atlanticus DSM 15807]
MKKLLSIFLLVVSIFAFSGIDWVKIDDNQLLISVLRANFVENTYPMIIFKGDNYNYVEDAITDSSKLISIQVYRKASGNGFFITSEKNGEKIWSLPYEDVTLNYGKLFKLNGDYVFLGSVAIDNESFIYISKINQDGEIIYEDEINSFADFCCARLESNSLKFLAYKQEFSQKYHKYLASGQEYSFSNSLNPINKEIKFKDIDGIITIPQVYINGKYYALTGYISHQVELYEINPNGKSKRKIVKIPFLIPNTSSEYKIIGYSDNSLFTFGMKQNPDGLLHINIIEIGLDGKILNTFDISSRIIKKYEKHGIYIENNLPTIKTADKKIMLFPRDIKILLTNGQQKYAVYILDIKYNAGYGLGILVDLLEF